MNYPPPIRNYDNPDEGLVVADTGGGRLYNAYPTDLYNPGSQRTVREHDHGEPKLQEPADHHFFTRTPAAAEECSRNETLPANVANGAVPPLMIIHETKEYEGGIRTTDGRLFVDGQPVLWPEIWREVRFMSPAEKATVMDDWWWRDYAMLKIYADAVGSTGNGLSERRLQSIWDTLKGYREGPPAHMTEEEHEEEFRDFIASLARQPAVRRR